MVRREKYPTQAKAKNAFDDLLKTFKKEEIRQGFPIEKYGRAHERAIVRIEKEGKIRWKLVTSDGVWLSVTNSDSVCHLMLFELYS